MKIWLVLPAYNEAANIPFILRGMREMLADQYNLSASVIVVDDGSKDDTAQVAATAVPGLDVEVLKNDGNKGLAYTFRRGVMRAAERAAPEDVIFTMDADNSHLTGQIPEMLQAIRSGRDVVVASRYRPGAVIRGVPGHRLLMSSGMAWLFRIVYPIPGVRDYSCGYRAYRAEFIQKGIAARGENLFPQQGFAVMVGTLIEMQKLMAIMSEIPLVLRYDNKIGASKMKVGKTVFQTLGILWKARMGGTR